MAESNSLYVDSRISADLSPASDEEAFVSGSSTTSAAFEDHSKEEEESHQDSMMALTDGLRQTLSLTSSPSPKENGDDRIVGGAQHAENSPCETPAKPSKRHLRLLDLPMDMLQEIIKEVTHTNDLTSLALTCSALHALAIPQMYSRFDIVWPDTLSTSDHPAGVDALSYGLATLVMGEDVFREIPASSRFKDASSPCGCCNHHAQVPTQPGTDATPKMRRGNYYAQYTRKFSVGNGPLVWVQEYSVTKETGKMLGTLVALAIARMVNLETFIWDMPTGVLRDVWIALSSLADRPGHECRLERVWVRWHDNSENAVRLGSSVPNASSLTLPATQSAFISSATNLPLLQRYGHVEYPSLSILPPLKSLTVLDIDEPSYLEEMAVLIERSRERLTELRIGISSKIYQADWVKPLASRPPGQQAASGTSISVTTDWPKVDGVLGILSGNSDRHFRSDSTTDKYPLQKEEKGQSNTYLSTEDRPIEPSSGGPALASGGSTTSDHLPESLSPQSEVTLSADQVPDVTNTPETGDTSSTHPVEQQPSAESIETKDPHEISTRPLKIPCQSPGASERPLLRLDTLELERVSLSIPVLLQAIDWTRITTLTILRCEGHEKLWRSLRRQFTPSTLRSTPKHGRKGNSPSSEYLLKLKHIHTDAVSPYLLLFIKDTIAPNTLETLFLHEAPMYDSIVHIDAIYRNVIRNHRMSLQKILIDSTERAPNGNEMATSRWRKWMFPRPMISFITSGRMPRLRELSMTIHSKDWHYFLQRLPYMPHLRALHIPHIARPVHRDPKELGLQILDIVTIRPEVGIGYIGMQTKCYEILEGKRGDKDGDLDDTDDSHSDGFVPGGDPWPASDTNEDDTDEDGAGSAIDSNSDLSSENHGSSDGDESGSECGRSRVTFRLREILFYDDKISIFKARHGVL